MSKHQDFDKETAAKKMYQKPRPSKEIEQEYFNFRAQLGEIHYISEVNRGNSQKIVMRMAELQDEHKEAKEREAKTTETTEPQAEVVPS